MTEPTSPSSTVRTPLGTRIRSLRMERSWSQAHLASLASIDRAEISRLENDRRPATLREIDALAAAFGLTIENLAPGTEVTAERDPAVRRLRDLTAALVAKDAELGQMQARIISLEGDLTREQDAHLIARKRIVELEGICERLRGVIRSANQQSQVLTQQNEILRTQLAHPRFDWGSALIGVLGSAALGAGVAAMTSNDED